VGGGETKTVQMTNIILHTARGFSVLTEVYPCFFLSFKANARVEVGKTGFVPHASQLVVNCAVLVVNMYVCMYVGFKTLFYVVRHLDSTASYLPTGLHLGFFLSWPSLFLPTSFSSVLVVNCVVLCTVCM